MGLTLKGNKMRLTNIRSAVYAVQQYESPAFSVDYIIRAYAVSDYTRTAESKAQEYQAGVASNPRTSWRAMVRHRVATVNRRAYAAVY